MRKIYEKFYNKIDAILDKILRSGINSINNTDHKFLSAYSKDDAIDMEIIIREENQNSFISNDGKFNFNYTHTTIIDSNIYHHGTIIVPDLLTKDDGLITGELDGYICVFPDKQAIPFFDKNDHDILEFCNGLEYELDSFIDYIVSTIEDEKSIL
jgi:hypothetical protein